MRLYCYKSPSFTERNSWGDQDKCGASFPWRVFNLGEVVQQNGHYGYAQFMCGYGGIGFFFRCVVLTGKFLRKYFWWWDVLNEEYQDRNDGVGGVLGVSLYFTQGYS